MNQGFTWKDSHEKSINNSSFLIMSDCHKHGQCNTDITNPSVHQTLDELDFERGIWYAAQYGDLDRVQKLLSQGTSVDSTCSVGYTALHYAARNGHLSTCKLLINAGASVNAVTKSGRATALHRAASAGKVDVVNLLLDESADVMLVDADGKTVLHRGAESGHVDIVKVLVKHNSQLKYVKDNKNKIPLDYVGLLSLDLTALLT